MTPAEIAARHSVALIRSVDLLQPLPTIAESVMAQLIQLHAHPTPDRAERVALDLDAVRRQVLRAREAMMREAAGGTPTA